jgi:NADPH:quinone reductase-like Zn-dependent oxidoreductase
LLELGAHRAEIETPKLSQSIVERKQIDAVLDLVGNTTFMDSLSMLRRGRRMCLAGWLGGIDPVNNFNPLLRGEPGGVKGDVSAERLPKSGSKKPETRLNIFSVPVRIRRAAGVSAVLGGEEP